MVDQSTDQGENRGSYKTSWCCALAVILGSTGLLGCASSPTAPVTARQSGDFNAPVVISAHPEKDAAAYNDSADQLSDADWRELEKLGPRPIWEQLGAGRPPRHLGDPHTTPSAVGVQTNGAHQSTALDESQLPIECISLPDGRVRIIWRLRSYGGPVVKAGRDAATARRTVEIAPPDLAPLVAVVTQTVGPTGNASPVPGENAIVITCPQALRTSVLSLLNDLDRPPRQVEIAAKIFEVSHDFDFQQGTELVLDRLASKGNQNLTSTFSAKRFLDAMKNPMGGPTQGSVLHLMQAFQSAGVSVDVSFQLLAETGLIQVVSEPRMTVAVGQTGYMLAGQEIPVESETVVNNAVTLGTQYKPVGVQLYITPETAGTERVKLHTISIVSAISGFNPTPQMTGGIPPIVNPIIDSREAETAVTVDDGSTLVISGLRMIRTTVREEKIPGLGELPVLGWLFKNHRSQQEQTDLYFFITPTLL